MLFTSVQGDDLDGYAEAAARMVELAAEQPGFLGIESARSEIGITISYWASEDAIASWRANLEHQEVQRQGYARWYSAFRLRVAKVEREYGFQRES